MQTVHLKNGDCHGYPIIRIKNKTIPLSLKISFSLLNIEYFDAFTAQIQCTPFYLHLTMYLKRVTITDRQQ